MKAYHGEQAIKDKFIKRVQAHRAADELVKGGVDGRRGDGSFRGCAVTCTMDTYNHAAYETEIGVPRMLARLEDGIFENLPDERAMAWPEEFLSAIPVGADLSLVGAKFLHWLLVDPKDGVIKYAATDESKRAIQHVGDLYAKKIAGEEVTPEQWQAARTGAWRFYRFAADAADAADAAAAAAADADADAAAAAADADAAAAADAAADADAAAADAAAAAAAAAAADAAAAAAADAAAADAAAAAADAAAAAAAGNYRRWSTVWKKEHQNSRVKQANKLLELLAASPVISEPPLQRAA